MPLVQLYRAARVHHGGHALVIAGVVQGSSAPPLLLMIMPITNEPPAMGGRVNGVRMRLLGWVTCAVTFCATAGLVVSWLR